MAVLTLTCPHCQTERVAFTSVAEFQHPRASRYFTMFFFCGKCFGGVCAKVNYAGSSIHSNQGALESISGVTVLEVHPKTSTIEAPGHLPGNIGSFYLQAADNLQRQNWDASGAMSRKAVDIATLKINPKLKGKLQERIDHLAADHLITPAMKDWAHAIRLDGNEAAHEDEFDEATARDLLSFTELFLMYAFTLPGMLEERKQRAEK